MQMVNHLPLILAISSPVTGHADGAVAVALPVLPDFSESQNQQLLTALVTAVVVGVNCPGFEITDGAWSLLNGTADLIAIDRFALDPVAYDARYFSPAFDLLDKPGTCAAKGPRIQPLIGMLTGLGGSRDAP